MSTPYDLAALAVKPVLSRDEVMALLSDFPESTMSLLTSRGIGPKFFLLGKRQFITRPAFEAWLHERQQTAAP